MIKKILIAITGFLIIQTNICAQATQPEERLTCNMRLKQPECNQPDKPKGSYHQITEQYSFGTDSLIRTVYSELSVTIRFTKKKEVIMFARQCLPICTSLNSYKYLYGKKGNWKMQSDTLIITWKYHKDNPKAKWERLKIKSSDKLKYERDYTNNYPVIGCKSALIPINKIPFIGYGN